MSAQERWLKVLPKPTRPQMAEDFRLEVQQEADGFLKLYVKPTFVLPPPKDPKWNYIVEIFAARFAGKGLSGFIQKPYNTCQPVGRTKALSINNDQLIHGQIPTTALQKWVFSIWCFLSAEADWCQPKKIYLRLQSA
jgi:hypothetical protein